MTVGTSRLVSVKVEVVLRIAADLQHALAELGERDGQVGRGRALADAALAIDGEHLGGADLDMSGSSCDLHAALAVAAALAFAWIARCSCRYPHVDAFEPVFQFFAGASQRASVASSGVQ